MLAGDAEFPAHLLRVRGWPSLRPKRGRMTSYPIVQGIEHVVYLLLHEGKSSGFHGHHGVGVLDEVLGESPSPMGVSRDTALRDLDDSLTFRGQPISSAISSGWAPAHLYILLHRLSLLMLHHVRARGWWAWSAMARVMAYLITRWHKLRTCNPAKIELLHGAYKPGCLPGLGRGRACRGLRNGDGHDQPGVGSPACAWPRGRCSWLQTPQPSRVSESAL